ncbi:MAG TPA: YqgE/AlgH family protein [Xanthomonadaceae bacterium]|jgi:putative transcriptional regulator|nr:YqgE/AlgH family protein [Xanthomonadaceae bacterium]
MQRDFLVNHFLIAVPAMDDPHFARGVTLLCEHNEHGAMGLLVNRPSDYRLAEVFEQMEIPTECAAIADDTVMVGGPVLPDRGFVLHDGGDEWPSTMRVAPGVAVTTSREILAAIARGSGPRRHLVALGYASWGAGQLEQELAENTWLTVPANQAILFDTPIEQRWHAAAKRLGVDLGQLPSYIGHA